MKKDNEEWRTIDGYPLYLVSNYGRVKSLPRQSGTQYRQYEHILSETKNTRYPFVVLCNNSVKKNKSVHRLVAQAFIPNPENKPQVNHIDGNRKSNHVLNLEWATAKENTNHATETGLQDRSKPQNRKRGEDDPNSKSVLQFSLHGVFLKKWVSMSEATRTIGVTVTSISSCCKKRQDEGGGYFWFYADDYIPGEEAILIKKRLYPKNMNDKYGGVCHICNKYYNQLYAHNTGGHRLHSKNQESYDKP